MRRLSPLISLGLLVSLAGPACAVDLEVSELVGAIKRGIADAQKSAGPPTMKIPWIEAEISYVVKQEGGGGVKLYVVTVDGRYATEAVQRVKYRLEPTAPIKVEGPGELSGAVAGLDGFENGLGRRYAELDGHSEALAQTLAEIVQQHGVGGIGCGHADRRTLHRDRAGDILAQVFGGEALERG